MQQITIFDLLENENTRPVRLIEFFAGYGSQALALKYLGVTFEHYKICEWAINSIIAYANLHRDELKDFGKDYSQLEGLSKSQVAQKLFEYGVSKDYSHPAKLEELNKMPETKLRKCYNSIKWTNNLVDINKVKGSDLNINNTNDYLHILTYSFPCQDLSAAGKRAGFEKGSGTRSGLLWEVERILSECGNKPQVLLMENVTQIHNKKNMGSFEDWISRLDELGYENYYKDLSSVDFGIPQTRKRTFMVSILKSENMNFTFPSKIKLVHRLKHLLDENVDEKYYLSDSMKKYIVANNGKWTGNNDKAIINKSIASTINTGEGSRRCDASNYICDQLEEDFNLKLIQVGNIYNAESNPQAGRVYDSEGLCPTIDTCTGGNRMPKIVVPLKRGYDCEVDMEKDNVDSEKVVEVGNYSKSGYNQTAIVGKNGVTPTVMENHGQVTAVVVGGIGEKKSNSGTQWYQQDRIYDADKVSITIATSYNPWYLYNLRIRKLTENECFRLMGLKNCDTQKVTDEQSMTSSLHLAGDSIVVQVLMAIFGKILGVNWEEKIDINGEWWK